MQKPGAYHLVISVSKGKKSQLFYAALFKQVDWKKVYDDHEAAGYSDGSFTFWVVPAQAKQLHRFTSVGFHHFAIRVSSKQKVDKMLAWCKAHKAEVVDPPAAYPQYQKSYYAIFFLDPDGLKLEVTYL